MIIPFLYINCWCALSPTRFCFDKDAFFKFLKLHFSAMSMNSSKFFSTSKKLASFVISLTGFYWKELETITIRQITATWVHPRFSGFRVTRSSVLCFADHCLSFVLFFGLVIVLSVLRYTASDYPFGIIKLFFL